MALFPEVWAQDDAAVVVAPTAAQIEIGFQCGEAPLGIFNWLFQTLMSTINALNVGDMVSKFRRINTTEGIQGGNDLEADITLRLDFGHLETITDTADTDVLAVLRNGVHKQVTRSAFVAGLSGGGGGGVTSGANIGTGTGDVFSAISGSALQFRRIKAGVGIAVATSGNDVIVTLGPVAGTLTVV